MLNDETRLISVDTLREGKTIEDIVRRAVNSVEPITATSPMVFTERKDGVHPECDPRTDRFEIAADAMGHVAQSMLARREAWLEKQEKAALGRVVEGNGANLPN